MLRNFRFEGRPIPSTTLWFSVPKIKLQESLGCRRSRKCLVSSLAFSNLT